MADDLEKAIQSAYGPMSSAQARNSAIAYLGQLSESAGGWRTFVDKLFSTSDVQTALMCLSLISDVVLHRYLALSPEERVDLKQGLFSFMQQIIGPSTPRELETRLAVVIVYLFKLDFPQEWPTFFSDLESLCLTPAKVEGAKAEEEGALPSPDGIRFWLTVLHIIHEEVVANDVNRTAADAAHGQILKDAMRDLAVSQLVETWYNLLVAFHETHRETVNSTLEVMRPYVDWIDINLVVNERFLPILFKLSVMPEYAAKTMETWTSLLEKGMERDPRAKLDLMQTLQLPRILAEVQPADDDTMEKVALLVNTMGVEVLDCFKSLGEAMAADAELNKLATDLLSCSLEHLFKYYNNEIDDTSRSVAEFARNYLQFVRKVKKMNEGVLSPEMIEHLRILLQIIHTKMRYDESFDFDDLSGEEDEFEEFRRALGEQFKMITKMEPDISYAYVESLITSIPAMTDPLDMEVALRCLWLVGEGTVDTATSNYTQFFIDAFRLLIDSKIFSFEEPRALVSQFFECVSRYSKLFAQTPDLITPLLDIWMSKHGVLHPHPPTRARRCSGFTLFVKNLKAPLQDYLMAIVEHLSGFASFRPDSFDHISYDEQLELLESFGVLVGFDRDDAAKHKQYIDLLVLPLVQNMSNIVEQKLYLNDVPHNQFHSKWLACLIRGVGTFSKGFPLPIVTTSGVRRIDTNAAPTEAMLFFAKAFEIVMQILGVLGHKEEIRSACVFYYQRMALCLNSSSLLPFLPVITDRLLTPLTVPNMNEYMMLLIKMITTYGVEIGENLNGTLGTIIAKVHELIGVVEASLTPQSDEERELAELRRQYICMIGTVVNAHLLEVFVSETNFGMLQTILDDLMQGCLAYADPAAQRFAFSAVSGMAKSWLGEGQGPPATLPEGFADSFLTWLYQFPVVAAFEVPFNPRFNLTDAKSSEALLEMAGLERVCLTALGPQFEQYLASQLPLTSLGCTPDVVAQYLEGLKSGSPPKQWKKFKSEFISYHRNLR